MGSPEDIYHFNQHYNIICYFQHWLYTASQEPGCSTSSTSLSHQLSLAIHPNSVGTSVITPRQSASFTILSPTGCFNIGYTFETHLKTQMLHKSHLSITSQLSTHRQILHRAWKCYCCTLYKQSFGEIRFKRWFVELSPILPQQPDTWTDRKGYSLRLTKSTRHC